jgi:pSer/pThr/pTyr-binding forkhead associated (FHA) protein
MWILEVLDCKKNFQVVSVKTLGASVVTVGRKSDCDIYLPSDKSISRKHAEFNISLSGVQVQDLKSTFGTSLDNGASSIPANKFVNVRDGSIIKFGNESTFVKVRKASIRFCATRLEKSEKDRVKVLARALGAEIVKSVEESTHVLCSRFSATVKTLTAIVMKKPVITLDWVEHIAHPDSKSVDFLDTAWHVQCDPARCSIIVCIVVTGPRVAMCR